MTKAEARDLMARGKLASTLATTLCIRDEKRSSEEKATLIAQIQAVQMAAGAVRLIVSMIEVDEGREPGDQLPPGAPTVEFLTKAMKTFGTILALEMHALAAVVTPQ